MKSCPLRASVTPRRWKFTLELEGPSWSPASLCQQWFQYIIIRLTDSQGGGRGEGETHQMLVVSKCQERGASAERARAHGGTFLLSLVLNF